FPSFIHSSQTGVAVRRHASVVVIAMVVAGFAAHGQQNAGPSPGSQPSPRPNTNLRADDKGNQLRLALKTGHISNYDESKVGQNTLPDPLTLPGGLRVSDAKTWRDRRRAEIVRLYEAEIYGKIPARTPKVTWEVAETDPAARSGTARMKRIVGRV